MTSLFNLYAQLDNEQRGAVDALGNTVVVAGPGSGKTRIAAVKAGVLIAQDYSVACLSYSNATAEKMLTDLLKVDIRETQLFVGTVHEFCLRFIVRRYAHLIKKILPDPWNSLPERWGLASKIQIEQVFDEVQQQLRIQRWRNGISSLTYLRRSEVSSETEWVRPIDRRIMLAYDKIMFQQQLLDFEMVIQLAVLIVKNVDWICDHLESEFQWLIIDEYQDLGGSLHTLTVHLASNTNIRILAVGDPDQIIYSDTGSDGRYMDRLVDSGFEKIRTKKCYRFGRHLIAASIAALGADEQRPYEPSAIVQSNGATYFHTDQWSVSKLSRFIVRDLLPNLLERASSPDQIAVLYPQRGDIVDALRMTLREYRSEEQSGVQIIEFTDERRAEIPSSPVVDWFLQCADWLVTGGVHSSFRFAQLYDFYSTLLCDADLRPPTDAEMQSKFQLHSILKSSADEDLNAYEWLSSLCDTLKLEHLLEEAGNRSGELMDLAAMKNLLGHDLSDETLQDLSHSNRKGKLVLTTIHSAKGREFEYVVVAGVQDGLIPWENRTHMLSHFRRLLYVACTRAKKELHLVYSKRLLLTEPWERVVGPSPFIDDIHQTVQALRK